MYVNVHGIYTNLLQTAIVVFPLESRGQDRIAAVTLVQYQYTVATLDLGHSSAKLSVINET